MSIEDVRSRLNKLRTNERFDRVMISGFLGLSAISGVGGDVAATTLEKWSCVVVGAASVIYAADNYFHFRSSSLTAASLEGVLAQYEIIEADASANQLNNKLFDQDQL